MVSASFIVVCLFLVLCVLKQPVIAHINGIRASTSITHEDPSGQTEAIVHNYKYYNILLVEFVVDVALHNISWHFCQKEMFDIVKIKIFGANIR